MGIESIGHLGRTATTPGASESITELPSSPSPQNTVSLLPIYIVKQGTVLGPVLNNCSLDDNCAEGQGYVMGTVAIKALEFVDDIADLNSGSENAANSNKIIVGIQERKRLTFAAENCRILKINSFDFSNTACVKGEDLKVVTQFKYLGDVLNSRGDNSEMIKDWVGKAVGTTNEIISLCKEVNFGKNQISNMLLLYRSIFIPRLIYNCETWTMPP